MARLKPYLGKTPPNPFAGQQYGRDQPAVGETEEFGALSPQFRLLVYLLPEIVYYEKKKKKETHLLEELKSMDATREKKAQTVLEMCGLKNLLWQERF